MVAGEFCELKFTSLKVSKVGHLWIRQIHRNLLIVGDQTINSGREFFFFVFFFNLLCFSDEQIQFSKVILPDARKI